MLKTFPRKRIKHCGGSQPRKGEDASHPARGGRNAEAFCMACVKYRKRSCLVLIEKTAPFYVSYYFFFFALGSSLFPAISSAMCSMMRFFR